MDKRTKQTWGVAAVVVLAGGTWGAIGYARSGEQNPVIGFLFCAVVFAPAGYLWGRGVTRPRRRPAPDDVERLWATRAAAAAFRDMFFLVVVAIWGLLLVPEWQDVGALAALAALVALGAADAGARYGILHLRERG